MIALMLMNILSTVFAKFYYGKKITWIRIFLTANHGLNHFIIINIGCYIPIQMKIFPDNFNTNGYIVKGLYKLLLWEEDNMDDNIFNSLRTGGSFFTYHQFQKFIPEIFYTVFLFVA